MTRRAVVFDCAGDPLFGTLDEGASETGLLIVSGGNEVRCGAWAGQAQLAARVAAEGHPVFRFDRRGVGDSGGVNRGFGSSAPDIAAALAAFRAEVAHLRRVVAFGNCDAASALMLFACDLPLDALILANPWTLDVNAAEAAQAPSALRRRYLARLTDPRAWRRLVSGKADLRKLGGGLRAAARQPFRSALVEEMRHALSRFEGSARILLARRDRTAQLFLEAWDSRDPRLVQLDSASHSFAAPSDFDWLAERVAALLDDG